MKKLVSSLRALTAFGTRILQTSMFKQLSWYTAAQIIVQVVAFLSAIIVSRYLGPINLGLYSFVQNYVGSFLTIVAGMDFYFMWKLAKSEDKQKDVFTFIGHKLNIYIVIILAGIISAWVILPRDVAIMVSIVLLPVCIQSLSIFASYTAIIHRAKLLSLVQVTGSVLLFVLKVILVMSKAPLYMFVVVAAIDLILNGVIFFLYYLREKSWREVFMQNSFPSFFHSFTFLYGIRFSIIALACWQLLLRVDQLILATIGNAYMLGIYSAAVKVAEVPNFLAGVLSTVLISRIAQVSTNADALSQHSLKKMMLTFFGTGSAIAILIIIFAPLAIHILYGGKFLDSVPVLRVYALSIPGMFMNYLFLGMYGAKDKHMFQVMIFGLSLLINGLLVYILTPLFGLGGAALATAIAYSVSALGFYIHIRVTRNNTLGE
jgi:O-antigen/teichoic acid export membrane protein